MSPGAGDGAAIGIAELLSDLRLRDIDIRVDGGEMRCSAPVGALTPELREKLRQRRNDILHFLNIAQSLAEQQRAIVPLRSGGAGCPIFAVPGHNGDVFCYREFARALGDDQPFYALQPPGLDGQGPPLPSIEALARYFAEQIRSFKPGDRPCIVAGFCAGGTVAFELAQQLCAGGARVSFLALIGAPYPTFFRAPGLKRRVLHRLERFRYHATELAGRTWVERGRYLYGQLDGSTGDDDAARDPVLRLRAAVEAATLAGVCQYTPRFFDGRVRLLLPCRYWAGAGFRALEWRHIARQTDCLFGPDGSTSDDMLREPRVGAFARLLQHCG